MYCTYTGHIECLGKLHQSIFRLIILFVIILREIYWSHRSFDPFVPTGDRFYLYSWAIRWIRVSTLFTRHTAKKRKKVNFYGQTLGKDKLYKSYTHQKKAVVYSTYSPG